MGETPPIRRQSVLLGRLDGGLGARSLGVELTIGKSRIALLKPDAYLEGIQSK